jgi:hypothetical protein
MDFRQVLLPPFQRGRAPADVFVDQQAILAQIIERQYPRFAGQSRDDFGQCSLPARRFDGAVVNGTDQV